MLSKHHVAPWVLRIQEEPSLISSIMCAFRDNDIQAVDRLAQAGPDGIRPSAHEGYDKYASDISELLTSLEAYSIDPSRLDQLYMDQELVRRTFSETAAVFDTVADQHFPPVPRALAQEWLAVSIGDRALEVAVATGANLPFYPDCRELTAIDISGGSVGHAIARLPHLGRSARVEVMNAEQMSFSDAYFDKVLVLCGLCCMGNPFRALSEIGRVTRPGGKVVLYEPSLSGSDCVDLVLYLLQPIGRELGAVWYDDFPPRTIPYNTFWNMAGMLDALGFHVARERIFDPPFNTLRMVECIKQ